MTGKELKLLYPNWFNPNENTLGYIRHEDIVRSFNFDILIDSHDGSFSGDSWYLLGNGSSYGYLVFGWGSCSRCDALLGCKDADDLAELYNQLLNKIVWKNSKADMYNYFKTKDWELEFYNDDSEFCEFKTLVLAETYSFPRINRFKEIINNEE